LTETNDVHTRARAPVRRVDLALDLPGGGDARGVPVAAGCPDGATGQAGLSAHPAATAATAAFQVRLLAPHTSKIQTSRYGQDGKWKASGPTRDCCRPARRFGLSWHEDSTGGPAAEPCVRPWGSTRSIMHGRRAVLLGGREDPMICHVCAEQAVGQCKSCGKFYCRQHGDVYCSPCRASIKPAGR